MKTHLYRIYPIAKPYTIVCTVFADTMEDHATHWLLKRDDRNVAMVWKSDAELVDSGEV